MKWRESGAEAHATEDGMNKRQKTGLKLLLAAFIFGMATGYLGALWQICAQKSLRAKYETGNMKYEIAAAEAGTRGSGAEAHAERR